MYYRLITNSLLEWKNSANRKPLMLRGARQVGKTTLIKNFAKEFDFFISLNLDKKQDLEIFASNSDLNKIIQILYLKNKINPPVGAKILVFIDEIQNSPNAIGFLRYFYEEYNHLFVIAAGSLLETVFNNKISFPVGRVEYLILRPFSFQEFLLAKQENAVYELINTLPFPEYGHQLSANLFAEYTLVGGMPEVVSTYLKTSNIATVTKLYNSLITTYLDDVEKYSNTENHTRIIRHIIKNSFALAGERIKFEGFANSFYKSRDVSECFQILQKTFLLSLVYPVTSTTVPIVENVRKSPKLHCLDTGIINNFNGIQTDILNNTLIDNVYGGKIAEHIVGQELLTIGDSVLVKNCFWTKESSQSNAEIDYILQYNNYLIPVEVKMGKTGKLRSVFEFIDIAPHKFAIRVYSGELKFEKCKTIKNKEFVLLNLPFYLVSQIYKYCELLINYDGT